ncbi:hypothetical protein KUTeg_001787 [Tegillarca granosa]|uniref:Pleckstrin homology domain-containing family A member 8 n=1 Tax=Tegillarca granosa TaxID=220873 RepID=A0ABQ9FV91_TEGGR|nr:hypothetical protein KUTeg_001787 [Tegillarca granosa]
MYDNVKKENRFLRCAHKLIAMEGVLLKWTNYLSGWQPRWFILDNGVLSYYKSQEEVNNGCKGSLKMSVCDIAVHSTDHCRLDLIIPGEQHFYVRASTPQERQQWLVALGSSKASLKNGRPPEDSELRLYCDLLMQQVHSVKSATQEEGQPDISKLDEATSLLGATCDTFIQTLEDCMKLVNATIVLESPHQIRDSPLTSQQSLILPNPKSSRHNLQRPSSGDSVSGQRRRTSPTSKEGTPLSSKQNSRRRTASETSYSDQSLSDLSFDVTREQTNNSDKVNQSLSRTHNQMRSRSQSQPIKHNEKDEKLVVGNTTHSSSNGIHSLDTNLDKTKCISGSNLSINSEDDFKDAIDARVPTFFSTMNPSFMDLKYDKDGGIPVEPFLGACKSLLPIFDKFNATAFAPVKMDFQGNIRKIQQKYSTNPESFLTLQSIVIAEMNSNQHHISSSATVALLWMKRGLQFIREFFFEVVEGKSDMVQSVGNAYSRTLKPFHGWVVRGVFAVAVKALPYKDVFLSLLGAPNSNVNSPLFMQSLMADLENHVSAMDVTIKVLNDFYKFHSLDEEGQV